MRTNEWGKTILYVYKYLSRVTEGIDKLVTRYALNSFYVQGEKKGENGVIAVTNKIIQLCERKAKLVNIKVLADYALKAVDIKYAQILIERYMDNDEAEVIAERKGLNIRTYYRRLYQAEVNFCQAMARRGFNEEKLCDYLKDEKWIIEVYEKFKYEKTEEYAEVA